MAEFSGESSLCLYGEGCMKLALRSVLKQTTTMLEAIQSPISKLCLNFILKDKTFRKAYDEITVHIQS